MERKANDSRRLVIRVSPYSLSFSTTDAGGQVVYESYPLNSGISLAANLREALHTSALLEGGFLRVMVMVSSPVLMIPIDLFDEEKIEELYHFTYTRQEQTAVIHHVLPDLNAVAVYSIHKDLRMVICDHYSDVRFLPTVAPIWNHMHQRSYTGPHQKLYGYFHDRKLEVFSFGQNRFKYCNTFTVNNPNDAMYYLLSAWKQLGLEAEHDELHLAGELPDGERLLEEIRQFVKRVFATNPAGEFNRAAVTQIQGMPYDLMTLYVKGK